MAKKIKPVTPGLRFRIAPIFDEITSSNPEKSLLKTLKKSGGRNSKGKMTVRNIGGGHKRKIRLIDFKRIKDGIDAIVKSIRRAVCDEKYRQIINNLDNPYGDNSAPKKVREAIESVDISDRKWFVKHKI